MRRISTWKVLGISISLLGIMIFLLSIGFLGSYYYISFAILVPICVWGFFARWGLKYLFWYNWYFKEMKSEFDKLQHKRYVMQLMVDEAYSLHIVGHDAEAWTERACENEISVNKILEEKERIGKRLLNLKSRYRLSKKAEKITQDIDQLFTEGRSDTIYDTPADTPSVSSREHIIPVAEETLPHADETIIQLYRRFTFDEIQSATHNFDVALVVGKGGFGKVYKGSVDNGAVVVAIKRLDHSSNQGDTEFRTEIEMLCKFRHCNLVSLIGYCDNNNERILVYEYIINGSLADHLYPRNGSRNGNNANLCWVQRLKICIGAARAIDYLHNGTSVLQRVIHRDVKSSNILLDENWAAKVSDFGLSKVASVSRSSTQVITAVKGTAGYCDPEYVFERRLTSKCDVYSFGVVLFEVLSGKPALDTRLPKEERRLAVRAQRCIRENNIHQLVDPNLEWQVRGNSLKAFVDIADKCLQDKGKKRPKMAEVVASLELALAAQTSTDSSLLNDDIFDIHSSGDNQERIGDSVIGV